VAGDWKAGDPPSNFGRVAAGLVDRVVPLAPQVESSAANPPRSALAHGLLLAIPPGSAGGADLNLNLNLNLERAVAQAERLIGAIQVPGRVSEGVRGFEKKAASGGYPEMGPGSWDFNLASKYYQGLFRTAQVLAEAMPDLPPFAPRPAAAEAAGRAPPHLDPLDPLDPLGASAWARATRLRRGLLRTALRAYETLDRAGLCSRDQASEFYCAPQLWKNAGVVAATLHSDLSQEISHEISQGVGESAVKRHETGKAKAAGTETPKSGRGGTEESPSPNEGRNRARKTNKKKKKKKQKNEGAEAAPEMADRSTQEMVHEAAAAAAAEVGEKMLEYWARFTDESKSRELLEIVRSGSNPYTGTFVHPLPSWLSEWRLKH